MWPLSASRSFDSVGFISKRADSCESTHARATESLETMVKSSTYTPIKTSHSTEPGVEPGEPVVEPGGEDAPWVAPFESGLGSDQRR